MFSCGLKGKWECQFKTCRCWTPWGGWWRESLKHVFLSFFIIHRTPIFLLPRPSTPAGTRREFIWCLHSRFKLLSLAFPKALSLSLSLSLCSNYYLFSSLPLPICAYFSIFCANCLLSRDVKRFNVLCKGGLDLAFSSIIPRLPGGRSPKPRGSWFLQID